MITETAKPDKIKSWILASRPKTLPAAIAPVIIGSSLAANDETFSLVSAIIALLCSLLIQIGTNFTNDLYDFLSGADKKDRPGPARVLASGYISINEMKAGIAIVFGTAFLLGLYLVWLGGFPVLVIGILSILAGMAYTAGPYPLAYNGLGDVFVFIFFGLVATIGTYYVQAFTVTTFSLLAAVPMGALITNILVVNNYRDSDDDRAAGKRTTAVIFGKSFAKVQYIVLLLLSYSVPVISYFYYKHDMWILLPLLTIPVAFRLIKMLFTCKGRELNDMLALTAKLSVIYSVLFSAGILA
ncbi:MAG: 1,4-dihydroxy-2-naphthoate polyprenyltransferase [Syntrophothermus sp.]